MLRHNSATAELHGGLSQSSGRQAAASIFFCLAHHSAFSWRVFSRRSWLFSQPRLLPALWRARPSGVARVARPFALLSGVKICGARSRAFAFRSGSFAQVFLSPSCCFCFTSG